MKTWVDRWHGLIRIIDMTDAYKRGKFLKTARIRGWDDPHQSAHQTMFRIEDEILGKDKGLDRNQMFYHGPVDVPFEELVNLASKMAQENNVAADPANQISVDFEEIKAIHAPRIPLVAGVEGVWSGSADEGGIGLNDLTDHYNEPRMITIRQSNAEAFRLAAKVWDRVKQAKTFHEAGEILREAGCKLHYYCAID